MKLTIAFPIAAFSMFAILNSACAGGLSMSLSLDRTQSSLEYNTVFGDNFNRSTNDVNGRIEAAYTVDINQFVGLAVGADVGLGKTRIVKEDAEFSNAYRKSGDYRVFIQPEFRLTDLTTLTARVGFADGRFTAGDGSASVDGRVYGIGIRTAISKHASVFLNYERTVYKDDEEGDKVRLQADATRAGVQYRF
jgi:hypothetical protein